MFTGPVVAIDFETYYASDYSVADLGYYAYTHDRQFDAYLVAAFDGEETFVGHPKEFNWEALRGKVVISHNAEFDSAVYARLVELGVAPDVAYADWLCTAACCAYLQLPRSLAGAVKSVYKTEVDKSQRKDAKGRLPGNDMFGIDQAMLDYAADDARWCWRLWQDLSPHWPEHERELYRLTVEAGSVGLPVDRAYLEASDLHLQKMIAAAEAAVPWRPIASNKEFFNYCLSCRIPAPASSAVASGEFQKWMQEHGETAPGRGAKAMQDLRSANRTLKVLRSMERRIKPDGRMVYGLKYCGAGPGRWSGDAGLNVQNLNRGAVHGVHLRHVFACPPGKIFGILDFAQIEARVLLWLAGDEQTLSIIRGGVDLYEAHARATMGYSDPAPMKIAEPQKRQLAKARVLGLGYGCGPVKFVEVARIMGGLNISHPESQRMVQEYRASNPLILKFWDRLERQFKAADGGDLNLRLPSGRHLIYRGVNAETMDAQVGNDITNWYGGKLTENFVQAAARDMLASAWLRCVRAGYRPLVSVHDELVFEFNEATAQADLQAVTALMSQCPPWAAGCPIEAEGKLSKEYCK